jgi:hypothetical protein
LSWPREVELEQGDRSPREALLLPAAISLVVSLVVNVLVDLVVLVVLPVAAAMLVIEVWSTAMVSVSALLLTACMIRTTKKHWT